MLHLQRGLNSARFITLKLRTSGPSRACGAHPTVKVIKNITNVAGCRDTRTAKSKESRGMIEHNSEVYNHPYRDLLPYIHVQ